MTVKEYLDNFNQEFEHPYTSTTLLKYINLVEQQIDILKTYLVAKIGRVLNTAQYDLPEGVEFDDIIKVHVNGVLYKKKDARAYNEKYSYWYEDSKLNLYPSPSETDAVDNPKIRIVYESRPAMKLIANIATDTLTIPDRFSEIYDYFILSKIAYNAKDYPEAQNHSTYCNAKIRDFEEYWENHRPQRPESDVIAYDNYSDSDFDNE
jgi:hypothetical protein